MLKKIFQKNEIAIEKAQEQNAVAPKRKWYLTVPILLLTAVFFFPAFIALFIIRIVQDKKYGRKTSKIVKALVSVALVIVIILTIGVIMIEVWEKELNQTIASGDYEKAYSMIVDEYPELTGLALGYYFDVFNASKDYSKLPQIIEEYYNSLEDKALFDDYIREVYNENKSNLPEEIREQIEIIFDKVDEAIALKTEQEKQEQKESKENNESKKEETPKKDTPKKETVKKEEEQKVDDEKTSEEKNSSKEETVTSEKTEEKSNDTTEQQDSYKERLVTSPEYILWYAEKNNIELYNIKKINKFYDEYQKIISANESDMVYLNYEKIKFSSKYNYVKQQKTFDSANNEILTASYVYIGQLKNDKPHGTGAILTTDGYMVYFGEFKNGQYSGFGMLYKIPGYDDLLDLEEYYGDNTQESLSRVNYCYYVGEFKENEFDGKGNYFVFPSVEKDFSNPPNKNIQIVVGEYSQGKPDGKYKYYADNYLYVDANIKNGILSVEGTVTIYYAGTTQIKYKGGIKDGYRNGEGKIYDKNGKLLFEGEIDDGNGAYEIIYPIGGD